MEFLIENSILKGISGKEEVTEIRIPEGITSIDREVFYHRTNLKNVTFPESLESIGFGAFMECTSLTEVELPQNLKRIGSRAFRNCSNLEKIVLPDGLESIGADAFGNCSRLKEINLPQTLHSVGCHEHLILNDPYYDLCWPSATFGSSIFAGCDSLADADGFILIDGVLYDYLGEAKQLLFLPDQTRIIGSYFAIHLPDYKGNIFERFDQKELIPPIGEIIIPEGVVSIRKYAFTEASLLKISVPSSVRSIEKGAFSYTYSDLLPYSYETFGRYYKSSVSEIHYCGDEYQWLEIDQKDSVERDFYKETGHYPYNPIDIFFTATIGRSYYTDETGRRVFRVGNWIAAYYGGAVFSPDELKRYFKQFEHYDKVILTEGIKTLEPDLFDEWTSLEYVFFEDTDGIDDFGNLWEKNFTIEDLNALDNAKLIKNYIVWKQAHDRNEELKYHYRWEKEMELRRHLEREAASKRNTTISKINKELKFQEERKSNAEKALAALGNFELNKMKTQIEIIKDATQQISISKSALSSAETTYKADLEEIKTIIRNKEIVLRNEASEIYTIPEDPTNK